MRKRYWAILAAVLSAIACGHTEPFTTSATELGPSGVGPDIRLTYNPEQDYWPTWTQDGQGILYSFIRPDTVAQHRCIGLLPSGGGTNIWQLCDDRAVEHDSVSSFPAYALDSGGQLLYMEAVALRGIQATTPARTTLWLADSAQPFQRRQLIAFPVQVAGQSVPWLADITWTSTTSFVALAQDFTALGHCFNCAPDDSIFTGQMVVTGTITSAGATLTAINGTAAANGYSLAEGGASVVFTLRDDHNLYRVPIAGGTPAKVAAALPPASTAQLLGVSCKGTVCVVADDLVHLTTVTTNGIVFPSITNGPTELRGVSLTTGAVELLRTTTGGIVATPKVSPVTGDVVAQTGGLFGRLQSFTTSAADLHLYLGLVQ